MRPSTRRSYSSARVNCSKGQRTWVGGGLGDQVGDDRFVDGHPGSVGGDGDRVAELGRGHRGEHEGAGADVGADTGVLQRPVEHVGADRGDESQVALVVDEAGDDVDELGAPVRVAARSHSSSWSMTTTSGPTFDAWCQRRRGRGLVPGGSTPPTAPRERGDRVVTRSTVTTVWPRREPRDQTRPHEGALARTGRSTTVASRRVRPTPSSSSTTASRPKNSAASASSNGRSPLYGLTPAAVATVETDGPHAAAESTTRRSSELTGDSTLPAGRPRPASPAPARRQSRTRVEDRWPWPAPRRDPPARRHLTDQARHGRRPPRGSTTTSSPIRAPPVSSSHSIQPRPRTSSRGPRHVFRAHRRAQRSRSR